MPIRDRVTSLLGALADAHEIGRRPFILLGHSLGGLLIKQIIRHCDTMGDQYEHFIDQLVGVIFFSTPHTGSGLVSLANFFDLIRATPLVQELANNHAYLRELDDWYRNYVSRTRLPNLKFFRNSANKGSTRGRRGVWRSALARHNRYSSGRRSSIYMQVLRSPKLDLPTDVEVYQSAILDITSYVSPNRRQTDPNFEHQRDRRGFPFASWLH